MTVFANGLEVSAQAQGVKVIAAFPDVCFTPPQTPATPPGVPIPYPNFGMDSDLTSGSSKVKIGGKPVSQENKSHYKKVSGDEAGSAPKKGVVTSKNMGKAYAQMWSMNVKVEGKGVVRFSDIMTTNHNSLPGNTPPMPEVGKPGPPVSFSSPTCLVGSYEDTNEECNKRGGQAHHIIPDEYLRNSKRADAHAAAKKAAADGTPDPTRLDPTFPTIEEGCCVCVGGNASGSTASEAKPKTARGKQAKATVLERGKSHAESSGGKNLATMRGHGFLHQFDEKFRDLEPTIDNALDTANDLLDECAVYEQSALDPECAGKAKECIKSQFGPAKEKGAKLKQITPRKQASRDKRRRKLGLS